MVFHIVKTEFSSEVKDVLHPTMCLGDEGWIEEFRKVLLLDTTARFPTRDFENEISIWWTQSITGAEELWRTGTRIEAAKLAFNLNVAKDLPAQALLEYRDRWDKYVSDMNDVASVTANRAYQTAAAWVRAEAEIAVVDSTVHTIIVAAVSAWLGMAIFTLDPVLSFMVLGLVLGIVLGLAFFMVVMMSWKIGSIEVISLVIFVGYSVTYSLHVAHSYAEASVDLLNEGKAGDEEAPLNLPTGQLSLRASRQLRTRLAIHHMGTAVLSSAFSTLGSSMFLLFCTMVIFKKLGSVIIAVTVLSVVCSLVSLPAFLMLMGPPPEPWHRRCMSFLRTTRGRLRRLKGE
jgi:hypothetical protein